MKKIVLLSLVLNFALLGAVAFLARKTPAEVEPKAPDGKKTFAERLMNRRARPKPKVVTVNVLGEKFNWRDVESADYKEYIANLRRIECPEETVRDIIVADVNKFYADQLKPFRKAPEPYRYWRNEHFRGGNRQSTEFYAEQSRIEKEKKKVLEDLLGEDYETILMQQYGVKTIPDQFGKNFPEEIKDQLAEIQRRFQEQSSEIYRKAKGFFDEDSQADLKKLQQKQVEEMAKILSPEDLFEWQVRYSQTVQNLKGNELSGFDVSEEEFRAIAKAKLDLEANLAKVEPGSGESGKARSSAEKAANEAIKEALGPERYQDYQRNQDWDYRGLADFADRHDIPKEQVAKVYDMKEDVQKAVRQINKDKTLTNEQRREKLIAVKQAMEQEVQTSLGQRGFKKWKNNAWWFRNIVLPRPMPKE